MSDISFLAFFLFVSFWIYTIVSVSRAKFKEQKQKTFWLIGVIFVPPLAIFYFFMKKNLLLK